MQWQLRHFILISVFLSVNASCLAPLTQEKTQGACTNFLFWQLKCKSVRSWSSLSPPSLPYNEHIPVSSCLSSNPFVVCLPFSLFCLLLCSCHSSLLLHLSFSLVLHLSLSSPGLTVLPLLHERFANRSLTLFVLPPLQYAALNIVCFTSS